MFFLARQCVIRETQVHISKVKVTTLGQRYKRGTFCCVLAIFPSRMDGFLNSMAQNFFLARGSVMRKIHIDIKGQGHKLLFKS